MQKISFFEEEIKYDLKNKKSLIAFFNNIFLEEKVNFNFLNIIFCTDEFLLSVNKKFLNHDFLTDVITFNLSEDSKKIEGEIYISIERVKENATIYKSDFTQEVIRVIIHGILHLCGYEDKRKKDSILIRGKENYYLNLLKFHVKPKY